MYQDREQEESPRLEWQIESVVVTPLAWALWWRKRPNPMYLGETFSRFVLCVEITYCAKEAGRPDVG